MDSSWDHSESVGCWASALATLPVTSNGNGRHHAAPQVDQGAPVPDKFDRIVNYLNSAVERASVSHWDCPSCGARGALSVSRGEKQLVVVTCHGYQSCDNKVVLDALGAMVGVKLYLADLCEDQRKRADVKVGPHTVSSRKLSAVKASQIEVKRVKWTWEARLPVGALTLLAGREGIGKSILVYTLAADITRGTLQGEHFGKPRSVIISASEDSWSQTIVPRLMAAGADLERIYRVDAITEDKPRKVPISLPSDVDALVELVTELGDVALLIFDPLVSRLDSKLGTNQSKEVREALEPLADILDTTALTGVGLIHVNKSNSTDPLSTILGSRAFTEVPRACLYVAKDPDDDTRCLLGQPKNNLGRTDLPTLSYSIVEHHVCDTDDGAITTGKLIWGASVDRDMSDVLADLNETSETRSLTSDCSEWLTDYLDTYKFCASDDIKRDAKRAGYSESTLQRARTRIKAKVRSLRFPRTTYWGSPKLTNEEFGELLESPVTSSDTSRPVSEPPQ